VSKFSKIISVITLLIGLVLIVLTNFFNQNTNEVVDSIESDFSDELLKLQAYSDGVKSSIKAGNYNFSEFDYPTFLYEGRQLISWNNSEFELSDFQGSSAEKINVSKNEKGIFVFNSSEIKVDSIKFLLITTFPVERKYPYQNKYLSKVLNPRIIPNGVEVSAEKRETDFSPIKWNDKVVFYISSPYQSVFESHILLIIQLLTILFILGLFSGIFLIAFEFSRNDKPKTGFGLLISSIILIRLLMLLFNFPNTFLNTDLFRSAIFISSNLNNSLGELLLNNLCLSMAVFYLVLNKDVLLTWFEKQSNDVVGFAMLCGLAVFSFYMLKVYFDLVFNLLTNSQLPLDVFSNIEFPYLSIVAYTSMLLFGISHFFINDLVLKISLVKSNLKQFFQILMLTIVLVLGISYLLNEDVLIVLITQSIYAFILFKYEFPIRLSKLKFGTFLYGLFAIFLLAAISASAVYKSHEFKELNKKEKLATKLLLDRDVEGEYLLNGMLERIEADVFINSLFVNPQSPKQQIFDRIERYFASGYFDNYNVNIELFDKEGNSMIPTRITENIDSVKQYFVDQHVSTDYENIYFQQDELGTVKRRYVCFMYFERYDNKTGFVLLKLNLKKQISKSVYPELLLERRFTGKNEFDYAIYTKNVLLYNIGDFNYKSEFQNAWFNNDRLYDEGLESNEMHHYAVKGKDKVVVITSEVYSYWAILSNFSFYFLIILIGAIIISIVNSLISSNKDKSLSFSTKILIYIGCAFAIPIAFVGFAVINTINTSYKSEIEKSYEKKTIAISEGLVGLLKKYTTNAENKESITNEISKISRTTRSDINLYNTKGKLITTSQPKVFDSGLLTASINSIAYQNIVKGNKDKIILDESIGKLDYKSSYIAIRDYNDGELLGIMSSPFFGSKNHLNRQKAEVFNNIINITTLIFIFSVWFTYLAVRRLTNPLIVIASKLKSTELKETNEPLDWKTNDEIGVLIQEYNKMLEKLEVSKVELAKNEKEAAWREMAKQVAHEIKNPLTPMKLTLQHLDRVMEKDDIRRKPLNSLLNQVDTLDEIVTSFSHFAKMPDPQNVDFDIKDELAKIIDLHPEKNILLTINTINDKVNADQKLLGRIFNNLILNAFQSMSDIGNPELKIALLNKDNIIQISFTDRGTGISEEIEDKVFIPNFSTKDSGSGIGLAVAKRGIEHAGGKIYFKSKVGKGTTFFIEIPVITA
jgi:two-component system nitrogen regulation sensor histidine kinase NtrY